jgi:dTDP-4-dehydrorhamnose 3,5-epimerase
MSQFEMEETGIAGLLAIRSRRVIDERGWFLRSFDADQFAAAGIHQADLVQENHSRSRRGVVRGLHGRAEPREAKLVRVARGAVYDVVVDLRPDSPSFLRWCGLRLDDSEHLQLRVPAGCAHGFQVLSGLADVCYKVDARYDPALDITLAWDDPQLAIAWPLPDEAVLSERDRAAPRLADIRDQLPAWYGPHHAG